MKLALLIGVVLGEEVVTGLFVAAVAAALVGIGLIARTGLSARKSSIPFAPFLAVGAVVALLVGHPAIYA